MPLRNRVAPDGAIEAVPERGAFTGNRGVLHDGARRLVRRWTTRAWICCVLDWKGVRRTPMTPGRWTELFFLDEATALAAGHRPCALCRRADFVRFRDAFARAHGPGEGRGGVWTAPAMDRLLHAARTARERPRVSADGLPDGAMVRLEGRPARAWLAAGGRLRPWGRGGYGPAEDPPAGDALLLTPAPTLAVLDAGYRPALHPSAFPGPAAAD
jgi:hypothetical protein